jgi:hypothetical protein
MSPDSVAEATEVAQGVRISWGSLQTEHPFFFCSATAATVAAAVAGASFDEQRTGAN